MGCQLAPDQCRAQHIAPRLRLAEPDGTDWEARCPLCGHGSFRVSVARERRYRHVWTCACKPRHCEAPEMRAALLALGVMPGCLGDYGTYARPVRDPAASARLEQAVRDILAAPHLRPSDMRIVLAEALGDKIPAESRSFVPWAMRIGIGRRQAFEAVARWCRPADSSSSPEGGVVDT
jgi:hypothetical protein